MEQTIDYCCTKFALEILQFSLFLGSLKENKSNELLRSKTDEGDVTVSFISLSLDEVAGRGRGRISTQMAELVILSII